MSEWRVHGVGGMTESLLQGAAWAVLESHHHQGTFDGRGMWQ